MPITESGVTYLTEDDVVQICMGLAAAFVGTGDPFDATLLDAGALSSAVAQPRQSFGGVELHPGLFQKAAVLARGIICDHPFVNGNKRTGMESASVFLEYNGWELRLTTDEYVALALDIAGAGLCKPPLDVEAISVRFESHSVPLET